MAPIYTKMDRAVFSTLLSQLPQQIITTSIITSSDNIQFVNEFNYEKKKKNINKQEEEEDGISGTSPGYFMGRQSITDAVTNTPIEC